MANYVQVTGAQTYIGAAADTKPTAAPVGSIAIEHDTDAQYRWTGSAWVQIDTITQGGTGTSTLGATKDAGANWTQSIGVSSALVATTDNTLTNITAAPTSGQKIVIDDVLVSADAACNVLFEEETSSTDLFRVYFAGAGSIQFTPRGKLKLATADKKVTSKASTTVNVFITILWHSEA